MAHGDAVVDGDGVELLGDAAGRLDLARHQLAEVLQMHMAGHELGEGIDHGDDRLAEIARPSCRWRATGRGRRPCCGRGWWCGNDRGARVNPDRVSRISTRSHVAARMSTSFSPELAGRRRRCKSAHVCSFSALGAPDYTRSGSYLPILGMIPWKPSTYPMPCFPKCNNGFWPSSSVIPSAAPIRPRLSDVHSGTGAVERELSRLSCSGLVSVERIGNQSTIAILGCLLFSRS